MFWSPVLCYKGHFHDTTDVPYILDNKIYHVVGKCFKISNRNLHTERSGNSAVSTRSDYPLVQSDQDSHCH